MRFRCPHCSQTAQSKSDLTGKYVRCPRCQQRFIAEPFEQPAPVAEQRRPAPRVEARKTVRRQPPREDDVEVRVTQRPAKKSGGWLLAVLGATFALASAAGIGIWLMLPEGEKKNDGNAQSGAPAAPKKKKESPANVSGGGKDLAEGDGKAEADGGDGKNGANPKDLAGKDRKAPQVPAYHVVDAWLSSLGPYAGAYHGWMEKGEEFAALKNLKSLKKLTVMQQPLDASVVAQFKQIKSLAFQPNTSLKGKFEPVDDLKLDSLTILDGRDEALRFYLRAIPPSRTLDLTGWHLSAAGLKELLAERGDLESLTVSYSQRQKRIGEDHLDALAQFTSLKSLDMTGYGILTEGSLKKLAPLQKLETLKLASTDVRNADLKDLTVFKNLRWLSLANTEVGSSGMAHLTQLENLERLNLDAAQVSDAGLVHLKACMKLKKLFLADTGVTGAGLKALAGMQLESLVVSPAILTDETFDDYRAALGDNARSVDLGHSKLTSHSFKKLAGLQLDHVTVPPRECGNVTLKSCLAAMKPLTFLDLSSWSALNDDCLDEIVKHKKTLRFLWFHPQASISDEGLKKLEEMRLQALFVPEMARTSRGLKSYLMALAEPPSALSLAYWNVKDDALKEVAQIKGLERLDLWDRIRRGGGINAQPSLTADGLKELAGMQLASLTVPPKMRSDLALKHYLAAVRPSTSLDLRDWPLTDDGVKELARLNDLQALDLSKWVAPKNPIPNDNLTDASFKVIAGLKKLETLELRGIKMTNQAVKELAGLPRLKKMGVIAGLSAADLKELAQYENLQSLALGGGGEQPITDACLKELAHFKNLRELTWADRSTEAGSNDWGELKNLESLTLVRSKVTPLDVKSLAGHAGLRSLKLRHVTGLETFDELEGLRNLKSLELVISQRGKNQNPDLSRLFRALPNCQITFIRSDVLFFK